jgi:hypothetical protein
MLGRKKNKWVEIEGCGKGRKEGKYNGC